MTLEQKRLRFGAGVIVGFGMLTWVALVFGVSSPLVLLLDLVTLGGDGAETLGKTPGQMLGAIMAGLCVGLGVIIWVMAGAHLVRMPHETRTALLAMIWSWYLVDSSGSILVGAPVNALANLTFLVLVVWPIWAARRDERPTATA
ncbi:hypothetical protein J7443_05850 [Tropicibacter sp. R15_0]|uniref:hypothetical protein n=1 Tax=Tropicibacter sp. R15_0 TaxID=2821101 RepID=UPI001ADC0AC0|nr:hypothetical protein [Tropicibacter sp. R15_0]MBO9464744.1 hypothetical protein [Tropicibacter sp. R15_0]